MIAYIYIQQIIAFYQFKIMQYLHLELRKRLHISNSESCNIYISNHG